MTTIAKIYDKLDEMDKRMILKSLREFGWGYSSVNDKSKQYLRYTEAAKKREFNLIPFMEQEIVYNALKDYSNKFQIHQHDCNIERYLCLRKMMGLIEDCIIKERLKKLEL